MASSKQKLNRVSVSRRRASKANNKATLNGFDIDIYNRPMETSSRDSEHGGIYVIVPCGRDIKHSKRLET